MEHFQSTDEIVRKSSKQWLTINGGKPTTPLGRLQLNCDRHGPFFSTGNRLNLFKDREVWAACATCEAEATERERLAVIERKREASRIERLSKIQRAGVPKRFQTRTMDTYKAETPQQIRALTAARDYVEQFPENVKRGNGLILAGHPGTGKSHLASAIMLGLVDKYTVRYLTCLEMIQEIRATWRKDSERGETDALEDFGSEIDLLVLDEIGVQYGTEGEITLMTAVLDQRYRNMRPTILLTNQDLAGFKAFVGDRVMDRLSETSKWIPFAWDSYRPTARKEADAL